MVKEEKNIKKKILMKRLRILRKNLKKLKRKRNNKILRMRGVLLNQKKMM